jgi:hypothetical protein
MRAAPNVSSGGFVFHGIRAGFDLMSSIPQQQGHGPAYREFMRALEIARGRLAVAMAMESKATPPDRWSYYRETEDKMRRYLKKLRSDRRSELEERLDLLELARALKRLPFAPDHGVARHGEAHQLCQKLREILAPLEQLETEPTE